MKINLTKRELGVSVFLVVFLVSGSGFFSKAQTTSNINEQIFELQQQIRELEEQAEKYKSNITEKQKEAQSLKNQIEILNSQIQKLRVQIEITGTQINATELQIQNLAGDIFDTQSVINKNKTVISALLRNLNDFDSQSLLALLLQNHEFSDFMNNLEYSQTIQERLLTTLISLKELKQNLENQKSEMELKKDELDNLNLKLGRQKISSEGTRQSRENLLQITRGQEARYKELLNEVEREKAEFFEQLRELEEEARKEGVFIVHITAKSIPPTGTFIFSLPYDDPIITQGYGYTAFARRGTYAGAPHNGVDMVSGFGSPIRAIGPGEVLASGFNNGWGNWVAVRHDNDLVSVYGHLRHLTHVPVGQRVDNGIIIGYEGSTGNSTGSHLHLSLYYDFFTYISRIEKRVYFNYFEGTLNPFDYM